MQASPLPDNIAPLKPSNETEVGRPSCSNGESPYLSESCAGLLLAWERCLTLVPAPSPPPAPDLPLFLLTVPPRTYLAYVDISALLSKSCLTWPVLVALGYPFGLGLFSLALWEENSGVTGMQSEI